MKKWVAAGGLIVVAAAIWFGLRKPSSEKIAVAAEPKPAVISTPASTPEVREPEPRAGTVPAETETQRLERIKRFGDIPWEKWVKVQAVVFDYGDLFVKIARSLDVTESDAANSVRRWQAQNLLKRERRADLVAAGLTPDEIVEVELHLIGSGPGLLDSLKDVSTTPQERRAMYRAWDAFDTEYRQSGGFSGPEIAVRERAAMGKYEQARAILGPERFTVFLKCDDLAYRRFATLAEDLGQPAALADQLWQIKSEFAIRRGSLPPPESDRVAFAQQNAVLSEDIRARVVGVVGEEAIEKNPAAFEQWLRPKPKAPVAPATP